METLLGYDPTLHQEPWHRLKGWYWDMVNCSPPPSQVTLKRITAERVELYICILPPGGNIPISMEPFLVDDLVPTEDDIECAVKRLQNHRSGGPSGMQSKHLKGWLELAKRKESDKSAGRKVAPDRGEDNRSTRWDRENGDGGE